MDPGFGRGVGPFIRDLSLQWLGVALFAISSFRAGVIFQSESAVV